MPDDRLLKSLPAAMDAVGTAGFEKHLADAIGSVRYNDFIAMARYSVRGKPGFLIHSHTFPSHMAGLYLSQFSDADPYIEHWRTAEDPGVVWLQDIAFSRKRYRTYTDVFLPQIGVCDEIGVSCLPSDAIPARFSVTTAGAYSPPGDVLEARRVFDVGAALYRVHIRALLEHESAPRYS